MRPETALSKLTRLTQQRATEFEIHEVRRILWEFSEVLIQYDLTSDYMQILKEVRDELIERGVS